MIRLIGWLLSPLGRLLGAALAALSVLAAVWGAGRRSARREMEARAQRRRAEDMERIAQDMAEAGDDPEAARRWLEAFGKERD